MMTMIYSSYSVLKTRTIALLQSQILCGTWNQSSNRPVRPSVNNHQHSVEPLLWLYLSKKKRYLPVVPGWWYWKVDGGTAMQVELKI